MRARKYTYIHYRQNIFKYAHAHIYEIIKKQIMWILLYTTQPDSRNHLFMRKWTLKNFACRSLIRLDIHLILLGLLSPTFPFSSRLFRARLYFIIFSPALCSMPRFAFAFIQFASFPRIPIVRVPPRVISPPSAAFFRLFQSHLTLCWQNIFTSP